MQKEVFKDCELYCGDALEILPTLGECADMIMTDPPYRLTSGGGNNSALGGCLNRDSYDNTGCIVTCDITFKEISDLCFNALRIGCHSYIMTNNRNMEEALRENRLSGFQFHNLLVWDKQTVTPNRFYMNRLEFCIMSYKNKTRFINNMSMDNLFSVKNSKGDGHPTQKPVELMKFWIKQSTQENETVLDPFMGVGATGVAARKLGRKFIGIEIEQKWFDVACKRIENADRQGEMF